MTAVRLSTSQVRYSDLVLAGDAFVTNRPERLPRRVLIDVVRGTVPRATCSPQEFIDLFIANLYQRVGGDVEIYRATPGEPRDEYLLLLKHRGPMHLTRITVSVQFQFGQAMIEIHPGVWAAPNLRSRLLNFILGVFSLAFTAALFVANVSAIGSAHWAALCWIGVPLAILAAGFSWNLMYAAIVGRVSTDDERSMRALAGVVQAVVHQTGRGVFDPVAAVRALA